MLSPPPPHRGGGGGGGGGCSAGGRGARAAGGRGEPGLVSPPRTAARHPAIGAGGRTAARRLRVRMMKLSKPPASPPRRRTAAAGADNCARAAEAAREGGRGPRGRHPESGPGGHAGMWIGEGARGGGGLRCTFKTTSDPSVFRTLRSKCASKLTPGPATHKTLSPVQNRDPDSNNISVKTTWES